MTKQGAILERGGKGRHVPHDRQNCRWSNVPSSRYNTFLAWSRCREQTRYWARSGECWVVGGGTREQEGLTDAELNKYLIYDQNGKGYWQGKRQYSRSHNA